MKMDKTTGLDICLLYNLIVESVCSWPKHSICGGGADRDDEL